MTVNDWQLASLLRHAVSSLVLPPGLFFSLFALGYAIWLVSRFRHRGRPSARAIALSRSLWVISLLLAWALSTRLIAGPWVRWVEGLAAKPLAASALQGTPIPGKPQAVVVLTAGLHRAMPEWPDGLVPQAPFLRRLIYAERLAKAQGLPLVIAGKGPIQGLDEAGFARRFLLEAQAPVVGRGQGGPGHRESSQARGANIIAESISTNTEEAATALQAMIAKGDVQPLQSIVLVTSATHMLRAAPIFSQAGFTVIAAPTAYQSSALSSPLDSFPSAVQLASSSEAMHALLGELWRRLKG